MTQNELTCCLSNFFASFFKTSGLSTWICSGSLFTTEISREMFFFRQNTLQYFNLRPSGYYSTWLQLAGQRFSFARCALLPGVSLLALFGGPLSLLPRSPFSFHLCFTLGWFVCRGRGFWGKHRGWSRHCWGSLETHTHTFVTYMNNYQQQLATDLLSN